MTNAPPMTKGRQPPGSRLGASPSSLVGHWWGIRHFPRGGAFVIPSFEMCHRRYMMHNPTFRLEPLEPRDTPTAVGGLDPTFGTAGKAVVDLGFSDHATAVVAAPD